MTTAHRTSAHARSVTQLSSTNPAVRIIPEWLGSGTLARRELHDAARALDAGEAALIVVGEATLAKGFERAVTRAAKTAKRELNATTDELAKDLTEAVTR